MGKDVNRHFTKGKIWTANNKYMKRGSTTAVTREMHIKTTVSYHRIPTRMALIHKTDTKPGIIRVARAEPSHIIETHRHSGNVCWFLNRLNIDLPYGNTFPHKNLYGNVHSSNIHCCCKLKTIPMADTWWMGQNMVNSDDKILWSKKKEQRAQHGWT